jgi:hypothetical protein
MIPIQASRPRIVFFTIHSTTPWWTYLASQIDFADVSVLSDLRGDGDWSLVDDFYRLMRKGDAAEVAVLRYGVAECDDIIRRCRSLRSLGRRLALTMIGGMTQAIEAAFDALDPQLVLTFTMDRYVMDVMERVARTRGIDFLEMTTSIIPNEVMFLRRGRLIPLQDASPDKVKAAVEMLCRPDFAPTYVRDASKFSTLRFLQVYGYFAMRGAFFNVWRYLRRDRLNIHFIDALKRLKHKVALRDVTVLSLMSLSWRERLDAVPRDRRVFLGLQLFPEASMDYWLEAADMLDHDDVILDYCEVLGRAGYHVFIKDHPLQFGFRQRQLFQRLAKLDSVTLVPYDVPANLLIGQGAVSITFTGTIGFQAALAGLCSVVTEPYYATQQHYLHVRKRADIEGLVERLKAWVPPADLRAARAEMVGHLVAASVEGDYFGWQNFDTQDQNAVAATLPLVRSLNRYLPRFLIRTGQALNSGAGDPNG